MTKEPAAPLKAVALRYHRDKDIAPTLKAKGTGQVAENIIEKAKEHGVPIQEDASLVQVLSQLELDQVIPPELYQVVAEVLSFVYTIDQRTEKQEKRTEKK